MATLGPVSRKSRDLFGPEKPFVKLQSAFLFFLKSRSFYIFLIRKIKRIEKFDGLKSLRCEDMEGIVAPEKGPKSFGTFEKQAPGQHRYMFTLASTHKKI